MSSIPEFFFSSRRRHTRLQGDWSSDVCSSDLAAQEAPAGVRIACERLQSARPEELEAQADALLDGRTDAIDVGGAPFLMAALQVYWVALASRLLPDQVPGLEIP